MALNKTFVSITHEIKNDISINQIAFDKYVITFKSKYDPASSDTPEHKIIFQCAAISPIRHKSNHWLDTSSQHLIDNEYKTFHRYDRNHPINTQLKSTMQQIPDPNTILNENLQNNFDQYFVINTRAKTLHEFVEFLNKKLN